MCKNSYLAGSSGGPIIDRAARELQALATSIDLDARAVANLSREQLASERRFQLALDYPLQRPRAVRRIVAVLGKVVTSPVRQVERDLSLFEPLTQPHELDIDNLAQFVAGQRMEHHNLIDAVQELRTEALPQNIERFLFHLLVILTSESENQGARDIGSHDHDSVAKIHCAAMTVGESPVVEQLQ